MKKLSGIGLLATLAFMTTAWGESLNIIMHKISADGVGDEIGVIVAEDSKYGLILDPRLANLSPGAHGFHVHQNPDCGPKDGKAGAAAGGHYDPKDSGKHEGPVGAGHLGDLPSLWVGPDGDAMLPVIAPRLKTADLKGRSLMLHEGGDNYSDEPAALGGGGARVACGVVE